MKYLWRHEETRRCLTGWADTKTLVIAKFFFWKPGTILQKTSKGLIRGLLYSILSQAPELIPDILPQQWDARLADPNVVLMAMNRSKQAFLALVNDHVHVGHKFAIFIDGLDEFEGNHADLVKLLIRWAERRPQEVKISVSSREWVAFQDLLKDFPTIQLHQLTRRDISRLVEDTLSHRLQSEIVEKSAGVFLWVTLILRDIEEGLLSGDTLQQLRRKVDSLPNELNELFWQLFNGIHRTDQREAYAILTIALQCPPDWPMIRFAFLENYLEDPDFAIGPRCVHMTEEDVKSKLDRLHRKIYGKLRGLLDVRPVDPGWEAVPTFARTIKFTHRSIAEFITSQEIQERIYIQLAEFDVPDALCQTFLAHLRTVPLGPGYLELPNDRNESEIFRISEGYPKFGNDFDGILGVDISTISATAPLRLCAFLDRMVTTFESGEDAQPSDHLTYLKLHDPGREFFPEHDPPVVFPAGLTIQRESRGSDIFLELILRTIFNLHLHFIGQHRHLGFPIIAFFILMGADPRVSLMLERASEGEDKLAPKFYYRSKRSSFEGLQGHGSVLPINRTPQLDLYIQTSGPEVPLNTLVGWWFGPFSKPLEDAINWIMERGGLLTADQRRQLREVFEPSLKSLVTFEAAEELRRSQEEHEQLPSTRIFYSKAHEL
ncbi:hypothetical protein BDV12DRAFT_194247 [Aspergillus spectabilis]